MVRCELTLYSWENYERYLLAGILLLISCTRPNRPLSMPTITRPMDVSLGQDLSCCAKWGTGQQRPMDVHLLPQCHGASHAVYQWQCRFWELLRDQSIFAYEPRDPCASGSGTIITPRIQVMLLLI
jgi:hypothetical protein